MKSLKEIEIQAKLANLRKEWSEAKKNGDWAMMAVFEKMARALEKTLPSQLIFKT